MDEHEQLHARKGEAINQGNVEKKNQSKDENAAPNADPDRSRGELNEGRPHPTKDVPAGDYPAQSRHDEVPPLGPRGPENADDPEVENIIPGRRNAAREDAADEESGRRSMPKNDLVRRRGDSPGEAGADWGYGATDRPEADEHYGSGANPEGLRGKDKQQGELRDQSSNLREPVVGERAETRRSPHQDAQHGADVRGNPPMVQGSGTIDSLPEGLRRERKGPYDKDLGRSEEAVQVPNGTGNR